MTLLPASQLAQGRRIAGMASILLALLPCSVFALDPAECAFMWNEANTRMASAATPNDFARAAEGYRQLVDRGVRNGPLFYNLGTALLRAGNPGAAEAALLRAERYSGTTPEILRNLLLAVRAQQKSEDATLPWYRVPLFWHYELSWRVRMTVTVLAFTGCWLALFLRLLRWRQTAAHLALIAAVLLVMFGSSIVSTWHLEARADAESRALAAGPRSANGVQDRQI